MPHVASFSKSILTNELSFIIHATCHYYDVVTMNLTEETMLTRLNKKDTKFGKFKIVGPKQPLDLKQMNIIRNVNTNPIHAYLRRPHLIHTYILVLVYYYNPSFTRYNIMVKLLLIGYFMGALPTSPL